MECQIDASVKNWGFITATDDGRLYVKLENEGNSTIISLNSNGLFFTLET